MPTVSIVIRALNEAEHLPALFSGLLRQTRQPDEVILVDSGSADDTVAIARAHGAEVVHIDPDGVLVRAGAQPRLRRTPPATSSCSSAPTSTRSTRSGSTCMVAPFERPDVGLVYGGQTGDSRSHFSELELLRTWFPDVERRRPADAVLQQRQLRGARRRRGGDCPTTRRSPGSRTSTGPSGRSPPAGSSSTQADARDRPHPQRAVRQDAQPLPPRGDRPPADLPRPARQPVRGARPVPARRSVATTSPPPPAGGCGRNLASIPEFRAAQYLGTWEGFRHRGEVSTSLRRRFYYPKGFTGLDRSVARRTR